MTLREDVLFAFLTVVFFFSSRRRHTRCSRDWSSDVCSSDLLRAGRSGRGGGSERERGRQLRASTRAGFPYLPAFRTPVRLRVWTNGPGDDTRAPEHKQPNLAGQPRPRQRYDRLDLLLEREPRGVEYHRVGGGSERRDRPRGIGAVPRLQHVGLAPQLGVPAPPPPPPPRPPPPRPAAPPPPPRA